METTPTLPTPAAKPGFSTKKVVLIILGAMFLTAGLAVGGTIWWYKYNFNPKPMRPVVLSEKEQAAFDSKLAVFGDPPMAPVTVNIPPLPAPQTPPPSQPPVVLAPPRELQVAAGEENRTIIITEREVNAYLAKQNLGENIQVSFAEGKLAAGIIVEAPPDFPVFAGQKMRVRLTFGTGLTPDRKLSFVFDDVSVGGISLPNAWLGDLKGVDLVEQNLQSDPGLQRFLDGIQSLEIHPGSAKVVLNK
ncbi:hypothetical protein [Brevifollis gellanilyticus]|uniref:Uncharacterized protein n=1 Tax=Brevifollis gellanilyticus TaxID=748831 RepID=A0A512MB61_9BACT|nr:hypothetical protein [Brevifollis gellanilyticus]GEP43975.1 hypothetical protein BGE01nite_32660 [Brevifollis gellanilyticus]